MNFLEKQQCLHIEGGTQLAEALNVKYVLIG